MSGPSKRTVLSVFATFATGGPQVRFAAIANRFGARYRHLVVAMDGNTACRERLSPALDVTFPPVTIRKGATLANIRTFRASLKAWQPDVLVTNNWGSIEWALANLRPVTRHVHIEDGFGPEERDRQLRRRVLMRRLALRRSVVVLPSKTLALIAQEDWRVPQECLHYIPNGIDLDRFPGVQNPAVAAGWRGSGPVVGTVAVLRAEKNIERLLRAFPRAAGRMDARLVIVGDGPERAALQATATSLGLDDRVTFLGHVADPAPLYAGFDIFAISSDTEQMPLSVMEAMAAGLAVVATEVGDVRATLSPANAAPITARDVGAFADRLGMLLYNPEMRARIGAANRAKALDAFDQERMFAAYAALFDGAGPQ